MYMERMIVLFKQCFLYFNRTRFLIFFPFVTEYLTCKETAPVMGCLKMRLKERRWFLLLSFKFKFKWCKYVKTFTYIYDNTSNFNFVNNRKTVSSVFQTLFGLLFKKLKEGQKCKVLKPKPFQQLSSQATIDSGRNGPMFAWWT